MKLGKIITHQNLNSTSKLEKIGDVILTPAHLLFGKKFVYFPSDNKSIQITQDNASLQKIMYKKGAWVKTALKIILSPCIVFLPIGLLIKSMSLLNRGTRKAYKASVEQLTYETISKDIYLDIAKSPLRYFHLSEDDDSRFYTFPQIKLRECACTNDAFNRLVSPHRMQLEERLVQDLMPLVDREQPLRVTSLGCGKLLSEFRLIGLLLAAGHKKIELNLIEPEMNLIYLKRIFEFYNKLNIAVKVNWYKTVEECRNKNMESFDALFVMDYDEMTDDSGKPFQAFIDARKCLTPEASSYLGFNGAFVISPDGQYDFLNNSGKIKKIIRILEKEFSKFNSDTLRIAIPKQIEGSLEFLIAVSEFAKKKNISKLEISNITPLDCVDTLFLTNFKTLLEDWINSGLSNSLEIAIADGTLEESQFDLVGPWIIFDNQDEDSKPLPKDEDLLKGTSPNGVVLTLCASGMSKRYEALSRNSKHIYKCD